jgi:Nif-specific regulatory protein
MKNLKDITLEKYEIIEKIGEGELGEVFKVKNLVNGEIRAIKVSHPKKESSLRLTREFQILRQLQHPNIVRVLDYGTIKDGRTYIAMEWVEGVPINVYFKGYSTELLEVIVSILDALDYIHSKKLVHGDLKPENLLIYKKNNKINVKILDFGFAGEITPTSVPRGTLGYIAPEIFRGQMDTRSDLYSLGVIIYEVLTGQKPFEAKSLYELIRKQLFNDFVPPDVIRPEVPEELNRLVVSLLNGTPNLRPPSAFDAFLEIFSLVKEKVSLKEISSRQKRILLNPAFIGRDEILEDFKKRLSKIKDGYPKFILYKGQKGIGKSRLLEELKFITQLENGEVVYLNLDLSGGKKSPLKESILSSIKDINIPSNIENKYKFFDILTQTLKNIGKQRSPFVLLIDNLENSSKEDIEFLRYFIYSLDGEYILLAGACESPSEDLKILLADLHQHALIEERNLEPLNEKEVEEFVKSTLGKGVALEHLASWLYKEVGGIPQTLKDSLEIFIENEVLTFGEKGWIYDSQKLSKDILKDLEKSVSIRFNRLDDDEKELLRSIAIFGDPIPVYILEEIIKRSNLFVILENLKTRGFLKQTDTELIEISDPLLRNIAISETPEGERKKYHRIFVNVLEKYKDSIKGISYIRSLAQHSYYAGLKRKAYRYALEAGKALKEIYAFPEALQYYERSLELAKATKNIADIPDIYEELGELSNILGEFDKALSYYKKVLSSISGEKKLKQIEIIRKMGRLFLKKGDVNSAERTFLKAKKLLRDKESKALAEIYNELGWTALSSGDLNKARKYFETALGLAEKLGNGLIPESLYSLAVVYWREREIDKTLEITSKALSMLPMYTKNPVLESWLYYQQALCFEEKGELDAAEESLKKVAESRKEVFDLIGLISVYNDLGYITYQKGQLHIALQYYDMGLNLAERINSREDIAIIEINRAGLFEEIGDFENACLSYDRAIFIMSSLKFEFYLMASFINKGSLLLKRGETKKALEYFEKGRNIVERIPDKKWHLECSSCLSLAYALLGDNKKRDDFLIETEKSLKETTNWYSKAKALLNLLQIDLIENNLEKVRLKVNEILKITNRFKNSIEHKRALVVQGFLNAMIDRDKKGLENMEKSLLSLRETGSKYYLAKGLLLKAKASLSLWKSHGDDTYLNKVFEALEEAKSLFKELDIKEGLDEISEIQASFIKEILAKGVSRTPPQKYLKTLYRISETINLLLEKENFFEAILDLVIELTGAERGVLFLLDQGQFKVAAGRKMDKETILDARRVSRSVLREASQKEAPVFVQDALTDPRFASSRSVLLNRIRSLLCVPLVSRGEVLGTIYLDSRVTTSLFSEEEKEFLVAVAHLLAATIDKTLAYRKLEEENIYLREALVFEDQKGQIIIGTSEEMQKVYRTIETVAPTESAVLLIGETGTGKGVLARMIHEKSGRKGKFVHVDTGAIPENLFESELFGYVRGAFTGAIRDKKGLIEEAEGGTLFLDEISNLTLQLQAKLLTVIEERTFRRVGDTEEKESDVRFIFATNKNLETEVKEGRFREDLYYRLTAVGVRVPPLRERREDIPVFVDHFIKKFNREFGKEVTGVTPKALKALMRYPWPGNVRELKNVLERAVLLAKGSRIDFEDLDPQITGWQEMEEKPISLKEEKAALEAKRIHRALIATQGNVKKAAELLSIRREQLYRLIKRYKIDLNRYRKRKKSS